MLYDNQYLVDHSGEYSTYLFSDKAEEILNAPSDKPKFIYLSYTAPHAAPEDLTEIVKKELEALNPGRKETIKKIWDLSFGIFLNFIS